MKLTDGIRNILVGNADELDGIVNSFRATIQKLGAFANKKEEESDVITEEMAKLDNERVLARDSALRARRISAKLEDILD